MKKEVEEAVLSDLEIMARGYSTFRNSVAKWSSSTTIRAVDDKAKQIEVDQDEEGEVKIILNTKKHKLFYIYTKLAKRVEVKRNARLLQLTRDLWSLLNPYNFKMLSKTIYLGFNKFVYSEIISAFYSDPTLAAINAVQDVKIDLRGGAKGISFKNFYDSVFELIDNNTKSTLVSEYERFLKNIHSK